MLTLKVAIRSDAGIEEFFFTASQPIKKTKNRATASVAIDFMSNYTFCVECL